MSPMGDLDELAHTFLTYCPGSAHAGPARVDLAAMEDALRQLCLAAQKAWPGLALSPLALVRSVAERLASSQAEATAQDTVELLRTLHAADLYLACACELQIAGAIEAFEERFLRGLPAVLSRSESSPQVIDEVCQQLRERLFVAAPGSRPKIASYDGRGTLAGWLRVVALRTAVSLHRSTRPERRQPLDEATLAALSPSESPELAYLKEHYRAAVKVALQRAIATLPAERINVLRLQLIDGMTLEQIGGLYRKNRSTIKRWLDDTRAHLLKELRRQLAPRIAADELGTVVDLVGSQLDLSLSRILRAAAP